MTFVLNLRLLGMAAAAGAEGPQLVLEPAHQAEGEISK